MRYMVFMKGDPPSGAAPDPAFLELMPKLIEGMRAYDEELRKAGVLVASEGLHPSWSGTRIKVDVNGRRTVLDGPFSESKEVVAGFYILDVKSREEAIEWASRCPVELALRPGSEEAELEIRQIADMPSGTDEAVAHLRDQISGCPVHPGRCSRPTGRSRRSGGSNPPD
jgi:hypothetical protein